VPDEKEVRKDGGKQQIQQLLQKSEVSLWLDHYDDIFSDFDPRPYSQRAISDDFLKEAKKVTREIKPGVLELRFLIPGNHQRAEHENMIRKRLREHFKKHADIMKDEQHAMVKKGGMIALTGFLLLIIAAWVDYVKREAFLWSVFTVVLEPAGWFTIWTGLDTILFKSKEKLPELEFYDKMSRAEIKFDTY
jgi:hypothetical protein